MTRLPTIHRGLAALMLVGFAAFGALAGAGVEYARGPQWEAKSTVLVQSTAADVLSLLLNGAATPVTAEDLSDVAGTIATPTVLATVARDLDDGSTPGTLGPHLSAEPVANSHLVTITAEADTKARAEKLADLAAKGLAATQKNAVSAATRDLPAGDAGTPQNDVSVRAGLIESRLEPIQLMGTGSAKQTSPSSTVPVALAVAGLAAAALVVIGLSLRKPAESPVPADDARRAAAAARRHRRRERAAEKGAA